MRRKPLRSSRKSRMRLVCVLVVVLLALLGLWVLNLLHVVGGSWSVSLNVIFTGLGSIIAFLQWHAQTTGEASGTAGMTAPNNADPHEPFLSDLATRRKGAIVVYTPRTWRGTTLHLLSGLQDASGPLEAASNVVEHRSAEQRQFLGHFPAVPPGHYTLVARSRQRQAQVTVYPGRLSEIDWR